MNDPDNVPVLGRADKLRVNALCDEFERALKAGNSPKIEDFLGRIDKRLHADALRELIKVEFELRRQDGESAHMDEYLQRFSNFTAAVRHACQRSDVALATELCNPSIQRTTSHREGAVGLKLERGSGRLEVRCPNCHAPTEVAVDTLLTDLTCGSCGSNFSLVDQGEETNLAPSLSKLGRFELVERLGVGAFGSVWKARDKELDRTVAVKVPRASAMTAVEQEKFFREARAAAQLRHPNIVSVHEVGRDGESVYIVSDFVRGVTLSDWLTGQQPTSRDAAALCAKIADALEHAHQQGVIHRDLKPANIMIDGAGEPHLMDFGLARREVGEITMTTDGQVLGTPAYMSPEQAMGEAHAADRRSDVYSLGVILFQLLTGELPFRGNARMLVHQVINDEPPSPRKFSAGISKDLETITLKCLEKEPVRRYQSARDVADELERYLVGKSIEARPIGVPERAIRWSRRNKLVSALVSAIAIALVAGSSVSFYFALDARTKAHTARLREQDALASRQDALRRQKEAEAARAKEAQSRERAEAVTKFLVRAFQSPDPNRDGHTITVAEVLDRSEEQLNKDLAEQPLTQATLLNAIGQSRSGLGLWEASIKDFTRARELTEKALGAEHPETLAAINWLAYAYRSAERPKEAAKLYRQLIALRNKKPVTDQQRWTDLTNLARAYRLGDKPEKAIPIHQQIIAERGERLGPTHLDTFSAKNNLAITYQSAGRNDDAIVLLQGIVAQCREKFGIEHNKTLIYSINLANAYIDAGRHEESIALLEQYLPARRRQIGDGDEQVRIAIRSLAFEYVRDGQKEKAEKLLEDFVAATRQKLGPDHPNTMEATNCAAVAYRSLGEYEKAIELHKDTLATCRRSLGDNHMRTMGQMGALAMTYEASGRIAEAIDLYERTYAKMRELLGARHLNTLITMNNLALAYEQGDRIDEAIPLYEQALDAGRKREDFDVAAVMRNLALAYESKGRLNDAILMYERRVALRQKSFDADAPEVLTSLHTLAGAYQRAGRLDDAAQVAKQILDQGEFFNGFILTTKIGSAAERSAIQIAADYQGEQTPRPIDSLLLGELRLVAGNPQSAERAIRAAIQREKSVPYYFKSLGWCLLAQGKSDEARQAFQELLRSKKLNDGTYNLETADPDQMTAAYFLDLISEDKYTEHLANNKRLACFPWFYVGQRHEIEGKTDVAIAAYKRCVELGSNGTGHSVRALANWRLGKLANGSP